MISNITVKPLGGGRGGEERREGEEGEGEKKKREEGAGRERWRAIGRGRTKGRGGGGGGGEGGGGEGVVPCNNSVFSKHTFVPVGRMASHSIEDHLSQIFLVSFLNLHSPRRAV